MNSLEKDPLYIRGIDRGIELERHLREIAIEQERKKAEAAIEQQRLKAEAEHRRVEEAEAELELERQKAEAERNTAIIELFQAGLSISTLSQVFRVTEAYIKELTASLPQNDQQ